MDDGLFRCVYCGKLMFRQICGYNSAELVAFAIACREAGIANKQLHNFVLTEEAAIREGFRRVKEEILKEI